MADVVTLESTLALKNNVSPTIEEMDKSFAELEKHFDEFDRFMEESGKKTGEAATEFEALDNVVEALVHGSFKDLLGALLDLPAAFGVVYEAITKTGEAVENLAKRGQMLTNKSLISGIDVEKLQTFERVANDAGGSLEQLTRAVTLLGRNADANKDIFKRLGIDPKELKLEDSATQLETIAKKIFDLQNPAERSAAAMGVFGRTGIQMLPTLKALAEGAGDLKIALSSGQVEALDALDQSISKAKGAWSDMWEQVVVIVAQSPLVKQAIDGIASAFRDLAVYLRDVVGPVVKQVAANWNEVFAANNAKTRMEILGTVSELEKLKKAGEDVSSAASKIHWWDASSASKAIQSAKEQGLTMDQLIAKMQKEADTYGALSDKQMKEVDDVRNGVIPAKEKAAAASGALTDKLTKEQLAAQRAAAAHEKLIAGIESQLSGEKAQQTVDNIAEAMDRLTPATSLTDEATMKFGKQLEELEKQSATIPPRLLDIIAKYNMLKAIKLGEKPFEFTDAQLGIKEKNPLDEKAMKTAGFGGQKGLNDFVATAQKAKIPLADIEMYLKQMGATAFEIKVAVEPITQEVNRVQAAAIMANAEFKKWGQAFQGLIQLAGLFGQTVSQVAQIASNTFNEFHAASESAMKAAEMPGTVLQGGALEAVTGKIKAGIGLTDEELQNYKKTTADATAKQEKFNATINAGAAVVGMLGGMLEKSANPAMQKFGGALQGAAAGAKLGAAFGPYGVVIGAVAGAIVGWIKKSKQMREEMKKLKDAFLDQHGGMEKLSAEAKAAGVNIDKAFSAKTPQQLKQNLDDVNKELDAFNGLLQTAGGSMDSLKSLAADAGVSLQAIWDAKNPQEYLKAVDDVKKSLDDWNNANDKLNGAMQKYGITVDQLGGKFRQSGMDKIGLDLLQSFKLLTAAGADVSLVTQKMSADMSDYVNRSLKAGTTIPEAMRPVLQQMIDNHQLIDENGKAYDSLADSGVKFAQTLEEGVSSAVDAINKLVEVLSKGFNIPVDVHPSGGGGGGGGNEGGGAGGAGQHGAPDENNFAGGSDGFRDFGVKGQPATLHGLEAVVRPMDLQSAMTSMMERGGITGRGDTNTVVSLQISENPMQTAETQEQMRKFTLETVDKEVARSLADAIANGKA